MSVTLHIEGSPADSGQSEQPTVVLCHGLGGSSRNFRAQQKALLGHARTVVYDARGHARSETPSEPEAYRGPCLVGDLARVIDENVSGRLILGGLSLGAWTALSYTRQHPERVSGLLLAAYPAATDKTRRWASEFADAILAVGLEKASSRYVTGPEGRFGGAAARVNRGLLEHAPLAIVAILRGILATLPPFDPAQLRSENLSMPVALVVGGRDLDSVQSSRELVTALKDARLTVVQGAGHVVNLQAPQAFNRELLRLVERAATHPAPASDSVLSRDFVDG